MWSRAGALTVGGCGAAPGRRSRVPRRGEPCSRADGFVGRGPPGVCLQPDLPSETRCSPPRTTPGHVAIVPPFYKTGNVLSHSGKRPGHTTFLGERNPLSCPIVKALLRQMPFSSLHRLKVAVKCSQRGNKDGSCVRGKRRRFELWQSLRPTAE